MTQDVHRDELKRSRVGRKLEFILDSHQGASRCGTGCENSYVLEGVDIYVRTIVLDGRPSWIYSEPSENLQVQYLAWSRYSTTRCRIPAIEDLQTKNPYQSTSNFDGGSPAVSATMQQYGPSPGSRRNTSTEMDEASRSFDVIASAWVSSVRSSEFTHCTRSMGASLPL